MGLTWNRADDDLVINEQPATRRRWDERPAPRHPSLYDVRPILPTFEDLLAAADANEYARPSQERLGLATASARRVPS